MAAELATSRYTFRLPVPGGFALFNGSTGSVLRLQGPDAAELSALLSGPRVLLPGGMFGDELTARLVHSGFLLGADFDEVAVVRKRYWAARRNAPVVLVITTTMDCNLGCYYCYESRSPDALRVTDVGELVGVARERLGRQGKRSLHVDWYGGEPMMNLEFLEEASLALQALCAAEGISYHASAISNGTHWPEDVGSFVARHRIRQVQISFDGLKANHDRRRRYRPAYRPSPDASSFDRASALVGELLQHTRVDVRYNADPGNADDFAGFLEHARQQGWFDAPCRCVVMPARLAAYTDRSAFMRRHQLGHEQFEVLEAGARRTLPVLAQDEPDTVGGFPHPKTSVCGALASDSAVVGADGLEYRCGLQVGEAHRAIGRFDTTGVQEAFPDRDWWDAFDPTTLPSCSRCSFLPLCWGGCPKRHLEGSQPDLDAESRFWRTQLPRLIATGLGEQAPPGFTFTEADQFRGEATPAG